MKKLLLKTVSIAVLTLIITVIFSFRVTANTTTLPGWISSGDPQRGYWECSCPAVFSECGCTV